MKFPINFRVSAALMAVLGLAACGGGIASDPTQSGIVDYDPSTVFTSLNFQGGNPTGIGTYSAGSGLENGAYVAYVQLNEIGSVGIPISSDVNFNSNIGLVGYKNIVTTGGLGSSLSGDQFLANGNMTLVGDFSENELNGDFSLVETSASGGSVPVVFRGVITDGVLSGTLTYNGYSADISGKIGEDHIIGAFHGNDVGITFAGGFTGDAP